MSAVVNAPGGDADAVVSRPGQRVQLSHRTVANRYPRLFQWAQDYAALAGIRTPRILSYGCSTGEEPSTLAELYFPRSRIQAVDIMPAVLDEARQRFGAQYPNIHFELSTPATIRDNGPYDIIFAMSVLCRSDCVSGEVLAGMFPFESFCEHLEILDSVLAPGGMMVLYNTSYRFADTPFAGAYLELRHPSPDVSNFLPVFRPDGRNAGADAARECVFVKTTDGTAAITRILTERAAIAPVPLPPAKAAAEPEPPRQPLPGEPGQRVHRSTATSFNQHPRLFSWAQTYCEEAGFIRPRVLSYGCASGEEPVTLAHAYFPGSPILGVDVEPDLVDKARRQFATSYPDVRFERSDPGLITRNGPYDVILALNVLCRTDARDAVHLAKVFPFESFERHIELLDSVLAPGGLLLLFNASHVFAETAVAHRYAEVRPRWEDIRNGVPMFRRDGQPADLQDRQATAFAKRAQATDALVRDMKVRYPMILLPPG